MRALFASVFACLVTLGPAARADGPPKEPVAFARETEAGRLAATIVNEEGRRCGHPGWAVGIVTRDGLLAGRGFGVRDKWSWKAVTPSTVFRIASITKAVAGVAVLQLRDEGKLALDDPMSRFLPEVARLIAPKDAPPITLRHVVTHTSGMPRDVPNGSLASEDTFLRMLQWTRLEAAPGKRTQYSNFAMGLVGPLVHRASGQAFRDYMQSKVFGPLGMTSTYWEMKDVPRDRRAWGYLKLTEERKTYEPAEGEWRMGAAEAFGGIYTSLEDMARFVAFELSSQQGAESPVLRRASLRESQHSAFSIDNQPQKHGVAWTVTDDGERGARVEHSGATDEYSATVMFYPKMNVGVVVLSNTAAPWDTENVARRALKRAADAGCGGP